MLVNLAVIAVVVCTLTIVTLMATAESEIVLRDVPRTIVSLFTRDRSHAEFPMYDTHYLDIYKAAISSPTLVCKTKIEGSKHKMCYLGENAIHIVNGEVAEVFLGAHCYIYSYDNWVEVNTYIHVPLIEELIGWMHYPDLHTSKLPKSEDSANYVVWKDENHSVYAYYNTHDMSLIKIFYHGTKYKVAYKQDGDKYAMISDDVRKSVLL